MINKYKFLAFLLFLMSCSHSLADETQLDDLLKEANTQNDLSLKTKREAAGHVKVFTRSKLDSMQIETLKDLIVYLPFIGYDESTFGLMNTGFMQMGRTNEILLSVYIDDHLLSLPYQGTTFQYYAMLNLHFVDHIDVYWGYPSFGLGVQASTTVIKLYTKKPERENTNTLGFAISNNGSSDIYGISAQSFDDFSYLLSLNNEKLKRKKVSFFDGYPLKKDQDLSNFYTSFYKNEHHLTLGGFYGEYDAFIGNSYLFKPIDSKIRFKNLFLGYDYTLPEDININMQYSHSQTKSHEIVEPIVPNDNAYYFIDKGFISYKDFLTKDFPFLSPRLNVISDPKYPNRNIINPNKPLGIYSKNLQERLFSLQLRKYFNFADHNVWLGYKYQYRDFDFKELTIDGRDIFQEDFDDKKEILNTIYAEDNILINDKNLITLAGKYNYFHHNSKIKDRHSYNLRIGYIFNDEHWFNKTFLNYARKSGDAYQFSNYYINGGGYPEDSIEKVATNEFGYKYDEGQMSVFVGRGDFTETSPDTYSTYNVYEANLKHQINNNHEIYMIIWLLKTKWQNLTPIVMREIAKIANKDLTTMEEKRYGGSLELISKYSQFNFSNSLVYLRSKMLEDSGFLYNFAIDYKINKHFDVFLKANNILNRSINTKYYGADIGSRSPLVLGTPLYERSVWLGMEYSF